MNQIFTISTNSEDTDIDSVPFLSAGEKKIFSNVFSKITNNPFDMASMFKVIQDYYGTLETVILSSKFSETKAIEIKRNKSLIQLDMEGNEIISDKNASFSDTKENALNLLGSVEKINQNELLIADSINKRVIIVDVNTNIVKWEYKSDRYIFDAHLVPYEVNILVNGGSENLESITIGQKINVIWTNNSGVDIGIYSGNVTNGSFDGVFDINSYGLNFKSEIIKNGETYVKSFDYEGEYGWFSYPNISIGKIIVSSLYNSKFNNYIITEGDSLDSQFTNRVIKIDSFGKEIWSFGQGYLTKPRDAKPLINNKYIIST